MSIRASWSNFRFLIIVGAGITCMVVLSIILTIWWLRAEAIVDASRDSKNLATVLADQIENSVQSIDLVLGDIKMELERRGSAAPNEFGRLLRSEDTYQLLKERLSHLQAAERILLVDKDGQSVTTTTQHLATAVDVSDRDYFQYIKNNNDNKIFIGQVYGDRRLGMQLVVFVKRINGANNEFLGLVLISINFNHFEKIYKSIASLRGQNFLLLQRDGTVIVRYPDSVVRSGEKVPSESPWHRMILQGGGEYRAPGFFDGEARLMAVKPLRNYSLAVNVGVLETAALAMWRIQATTLGVGMLLLIFSVGFLLKALSKQFLRIATSEATVEAALNNMSQGLVMFDSSNRLLVCNQRYLKMYGLSSDIVRPGAPFQDLVKHRAATGSFCANEVDQYIVDIQAALSNGTIFSRITSLHDGRIISIINHPTTGGGWVATHEDITEQKRAEERIAYEAQVDSLTGLPNRRSFYGHLEVMLKRVARGERLAVMYLDLDHLKRVNDTLGHPIGDKLLMGVAARLLGCVRNTDVVARLSGDEFAIVQSMIDQPVNVAEFAIRIRDAIHQPFEFDGHKVVVDISIGIALAPNDATELDALLKAADIALYEAKNSGRGTYSFYEPEMNARMRGRARLELDLESAFAKGEFELFYQPIINLADNKISSFEALLRWHHPERGLVSPAEFIPIAEEMGLIIPLGEWIVRTACAEAATWPDDIGVAVNISAVQLTNKNLVNAVVGAVASAGLKPSRLELEITESILMQNTFANLTMLKNLHELGVQFAMDDFGTGYSSLGYLLSFPFHKIKIDRCFIAALTENIESHAIVRAITDLSRSLKLEVTAEGVETAQQLEQVRMLGCASVQGYLFSQPRPAAEILQLLPSHVDGKVSVMEASLPRDQKNRKMCSIRPDRVCNHLLTGRECDVLMGIMASNTSKESARQLNISPRTVELHRARIKKKFDAKNSADLVQIMLNKGCSPSSSKSDFLQALSSDIEVATSPVLSRRLN